MFGVHPKSRSELAVIPLHSQNGRNLCHGEKKTGCVLMDIKENVTWRVSTVSGKEGCTLNGILFIHEFIQQMFINKG